MPVQMVEKMFATNLFGPIRLTKGLLAAYADSRRGRVVVVSSHAAVMRRRGDKRRTGPVRARSNGGQSRFRWRSHPSGSVSACSWPERSRPTFSNSRSHGRTRPVPYAPLQRRSSRRGKRWSGSLAGQIDFHLWSSSALLETKPFARHAVGPDAIRNGMYGNRLLPTRWLQSLTVQLRPFATGRIARCSPFGSTCERPTWAASDRGTSTRGTVGDHRAELRSPESAAPALTTPPSSP